MIHLVDLQDQPITRLRLALKKNGRKSSVAQSGLKGIRSLFRDPPLKKNITVISQPVVLNSETSLPNRLTYSVLEI